MRGKLVIIYLFYLILLLEATSRIYLSVTQNVPFFAPQETIYTFYPELRAIEASGTAASDDYFDVLLLGGSVLRPEWGNVPAALSRELLQKPGLKIRIHNAAAQGHTSRDSYFKYRYLRHMSFDAVFFYHGINETRTNNCPPELFREDYSHYYQWYSLLNLYDQHPEMRWLSFPYTIRLGWLLWQEEKNKTKKIKPGRLNPQWLKYGNQVKSHLALQKNLQAITQIAGEKQEKIFIGTFSYHMPDNYSIRKFQRRQLDYGRHRSAIELWGQPENVRLALLRHNEIIRQFTLQNPGTTIIDLQATLPVGKTNFDDICHLTEKGSIAFAKRIAEKLSISK